MKQCLRCKQVLHKTEFSKRKSRKDGLEYYCKKCLHKYYKKYKITHWEEIRRRMKRYQLNIRLEAMKKVSGGKLICEECGCDDLRFLEINHINCGGRKEHRQAGNLAFYRAIASGERKTDDLNLLCMPCNRLHYLEKKYGKDATKNWKLKWK